MTRRSTGLSAVEVLLSVCVVGLLAALAVPRWQRPPAPHEPSSERVGAVLADLRAAIDGYWAAHEGFPGSAGPASLPQELRAPLPCNPVTGTNDVRITTPLPGQPAGIEAWVYDSRSGQIRANVTGRAPDGTRWYDL